MTTSESGPPRRPKPPCPRCGGDRQVRRIGDYLRHTCITCGHGEEEYQPRGLAYETTTPPKPVEPLRSNNMPETDSNDEQSAFESLIAKFDAGLEINEPASIRRLLHAELDAASGRYPQTPIVQYYDGTPARVSWLDQHGILRHRPFDGPFPPGYPQRLAVHQCQQVLFRLLGMEKHPARERAYAMLAGLHCFDAKAGRQVNASLACLGMDDDGKRRLIASLHGGPPVSELLLQRCGLAQHQTEGSE